MDRFTYTRRRKARALRHYMLLLIGIISVTWACNADTSATPQPAPVVDTIQPAKRIVPPGSMAIKSTAEADSSLPVLLMTAAAAGFMEIDAARTALRITGNADIQKFAAMMVHKYTIVNDDIRILLGKRKISMPQKISREDKQRINQLKPNRDFDKAYIDMTVKNHQEMIMLLESELAVYESTNIEIATFITETLVKIKSYRDAAIVIRGKLS